MKKFTMITIIVALTIVSAFASTSFKAEDFEGKYCRLDMGFSSDYNELIYTYEVGEDEFRLSDNVYLSITFQIKDGEALNIRAKEMGYLVIDGEDSEIDFEELNRTFELFEKYGKISMGANYAKVVMTSSTLVELAKTGYVMGY